jgi:hypothetical protein
MGSFGSSILIEAEHIEAMNQGTMNQWINEQMNQ